VFRTSLIEHSFASALYLHTNGKVKYEKYKLRERNWRNGRTKDTIR